MAIRTSEELMQAVRERVGEDTSDETLAFISDISDTLAHLTGKNNEQTDWERKYRENDEAWRKKYRDRFFGNGDNDNDEDEPPRSPNRNTKKLTFEDLFKEE